MTPLAAFQGTLLQWIGFLDGYSLEMLRRVPEPGAWSLGQVYTHLIQDTGYFVGQMWICLSGGTVASGGMNPGGERLFALGSLPDARLEGPSTGVVIAQPASIGQVRERLLAIREAVDALDFTQPSGKTAHPGFGLFSATEWLQFAEMHLRHHFRQKIRIDDVIFG